MSTPTTNAVYLQDDFLWIGVVGDQTGETIRLMGDQIQALVEQLRAEGKPVLIMDDLRRIGSANAEALRGVAILSRVLDYDRAVMLDNHSALMRAGTNMLLRSIGRANARYFSDLDKAQAWLLEVKQDNAAPRERSRR